MKICAIIPVKGREPLLYHTVKRLTRQGIITICVGHTHSEKLVCETAGAEFITVREGLITLGGKWQYALDHARDHSPDAVLYMGSSDWVSDNWCEVLYKDIQSGYAMSGTKGIYFLDIQPENKKEMIWWGGYLKERSEEPIGTGRLFSGKALDMMDWQLFDITKQSSIDFCQMVSLEGIRPQWGEKLVSYNASLDIGALSISTYRWRNKHDFKRERKYPTARVIDNPDIIIEKYFPEALNLFNE